MKLTEELVPIGRFARLSGLTVKALRHYDEIGLLRPAHVDESSGYRYYALTQARSAEAIRRLRSLEVPLDEVRDLLDADQSALREHLVVHRSRLEGLAVETRRILDELDRLIDGKEKLVPETKDLIRLELQIKEVPSRRVALVRERAHIDEMTKVVPAGIDRVAHTIGMRHAGPPFCRCPFADPDGYLETEIGWPVDEDVDAESPVEITTYGATRALVMKHVGPYTELSRSYRLMAEAMDQHGLVSAGDPVEWYESDPEEVPDPKDYVTIIEWPIGPEGKL
ncbi:MAG: MerR family transcriptional regulator [Actinomycetota bacterium]